MKTHESVWAIFGIEISDLIIDIALKTSFNRFNTMHGEREREERASNILLSFVVFYLVRL